MYWINCDEDGHCINPSFALEMKLFEMPTFEEVIDEVKLKAEKFDPEEVQRLCRGISRLNTSEKWIDENVIVVQASHSLIQMLDYSPRLNVSFCEEEFIQIAEILWERFEKEVRLPPLPVFKYVPTPSEASTTTISIEDIADDFKMLQITLEGLEQKITEQGKQLVGIERKLNQQDKQLRILTEKTTKHEISLQGERLYSIESKLKQQDKHLHILATKAAEYEKSLEGRFGKARQMLEARVRHMKEMEKMAQELVSELDREGFPSEVVTRLIEMFRSDASEAMDEVMGK